MTRIFIAPDDGQEYALVPKVATDAMVVAAVKARHGDAVYKCVSTDGTNKMAEEFADDYNAALAAAPPVKVVELPERLTFKHNDFMGWNAYRTEIERRAKE